MRRQIWGALALYKDRCKTRPRTHTNSSENRTRNYRKIL